MGINNRLDKLERAYRPEQRVMVFSVSLRGEEPPEGARELVDEYVSSRPWLGDASRAEWTKRTDADEYGVQVGEEHFHVTRAGARPVPPPRIMTFSLKLDNPNDAGEEEER